MKPSPKDKERIVQITMNQTQLFCLSNRGNLWIYDSGESKWKKLKGPLSNKN